MSQKNKSRSFKLPKPLTEKQSSLIHAIMTKDMVLVTGSAGTGKSYIPTAYAAYFYHLGLADKIIFVKPMIPIGKGQGFLPGTSEEKNLPWIASFLADLTQFLSKGEVDCMQKNGKLIIEPFDYIRGKTFHNAFIILDEAQNCTKKEMIAFITRIGESSKVVIDGDTFQSDLKNGEKSGLEYLQYLLEDVNNEELAKRIGQVEFTSADCIRSPLCKMWLAAIEGDSN